MHWHMKRSLRRGEDGRIGKEDSFTSAARHTRGVDPNDKKEVGIIFGRKKGAVVEENKVPLIKNTSRHGEN